MGLIVTPPNKELEKETLARRVTGMIGEYDVLEELERGHITAVCKGLDLRRGRTVALKVILAEDLSEEQLQPIREALHREAAIAVRLKHPGIVSVMGIAADSAGNPCIVMELVEGETLERALELGLGSRGLARSFSLAERLGMAIEIAGALEYMHGHGVVHRDIKPSNVLLSEQCHPCIVDFGIATLVDGKDSLHGALPGTPAFVAPELLNDSPPSTRSDIFSFGVLLYWMFTGQIPFSGDTVTEIIENVAHADPPPVQQHNWALPKELDHVLGKCLAKDPPSRYGTARELACDLTDLRRICASPASEQAGAQPVRGNRSGPAAPQTPAANPPAAAPPEQDCSREQSASARPANRQSLTLTQEGIHGNHRHAADLMSQLAVRYHQEGRFAEAEELYCQALHTRESELGSWDEKVATSLNNLALLYRDQGRMEKAEKMLERSLTIVEKVFGPGHPKTALRLSNLADLLYRQCDWRHAEALYSRLAKMLATGQAAVRRSEITSSLENYEALLRETARTADANRIKGLIQTHRPVPAGKK